MFFCVFFLAYFNLYSAGTQHGNLHPTGWPIIFCGPTQEPVLAKANTGKNCERFWKNAGEWNGRLEISKEEIPGSKRSMYSYIYWPTPGFKGRTFRLCVLNRWDFNFCVCSSPLRECTMVLVWFEHSVECYLPPLIAADVSRQSVHVHHNIFWKFSSKSTSLSLRCLAVAGEENVAAIVRGFRAEY